MLMYGRCQHNVVKQLASNLKKKNKTCYTAFHLCGNSFLQSRRPGPLSLTAGLVARTWCSRHRVPPQSLAGNPSPAANHCKLRLLKISVTPQTKDFQPRIPRLDFLISEKPTFIFTKWEDAPEYTDIGSLGVCSGLVCITCAPTTEPGS